jgi:hypothetical protein
MVKRLEKSVSKWITDFNWTEEHEDELYAEIDKFGGRCWYEETRTKLNNDGTWERSKITQINVSLGRRDSGWGDVETAVPLVKCFDAVVDELVYNKRGRKLFLLLLIELFKDNPNILKEIK